MTIEHAEHQPAQAPARDKQEQDLFAAAHAHKPKRTLGLKLFDALFYGGVVNTIILLVSAASTYWTYHGNTVGKPGSVLRWIGETFHKRRQPIEKTLGKIGIEGEAAKIGTTVFWSFFDGTLFAPLIKLIEDRRERIALFIDTMLGTKADNMRAYDAEPKQGWKSVLAGRLETLGIVLPVAIIMEKTGGNKRVFYDGGEKIMGMIEKHAPALDKQMASLVSAPHAPEFAAQLPIRKKSLFHVLTFEAFYTSICTLGTYLFSRGFARHHTPADKHADAHHSATGSDAKGEAAPSVSPETAMKPAASITHPTLIERVAPLAPAHELFNA